MKLLSARELGDFAEERDQFGDGPWRRSWGRLPHREEADADTKDKDKDATTDIDIESLNLNDAREVHDLSKPAREHTQAPPPARHHMRRMSRYWHWSAHPENVRGRGRRLSDANLHSTIAGFFGVGRGSAGAAAAKLSGTQDQKTLASDEVGVRAEVRELRVRQRSAFLKKTSGYVARIGRETSKGTLRQRNYLKGLMRTM